MRWDKEVIFHLRNLEKNRIAIKNLEERLAVKEEQKFNLKCQNSEDIKVQTSLENTDVLLNLIVECDEVRKQLRDVMFEVKWIETGMDCLNDIEIQCLTEFYINNNPHAACVLASSLNYSNAHIYRIRNNALNKLVANLYGCC